MIDIIKQKELKFFEMLTLALSVFIKNFKSIVLVTLVLFLPLSILNVLISQRLGNAAVVIMDIMQKSGGNTEQLLNQPDVIKILWTNIFLLFLLIVFLEPIGIIAIAKLTKAYLTGEEVSKNKILSESINRMGAVVLTGIPYAVIMIVGMMAFAIPNIYFGCVWTFYVYVIAFTDKKGFAALRQSHALVKGKFLKTFSLVLLATIIVSIWGRMFDIIYMFIPFSLPVSIFYTWFVYIIQTILFIFMTIFYMNRDFLNNNNFIDNTIIDN